MKVVSNDALTKLIQLSKDEFLSKNNTTTVTTSGLKTINGESILGTGNIDTAGLPSQTGQSGKFLTTNGTDASWATVDVLPSQTSQSGKFLTTNGTAVSWANIPTELPSQTGQSGKYLTTNGTTASWADASGSTITYWEDD